MLLKPPRAGRQIRIVDPQGSRPHPGLICSGRISKSGKISEIRHVSPAEPSPRASRRTHGFCIRCVLSDTISWTAGIYQISSFIYRILYISLIPKLEITAQGGLVALRDSRILTESCWWTVPPWPITTSGREHLEPSHAAPRDPHRLQHQAGRLGPPRLVAARGPEHPPTREPERSRGRHRRCGAGERLAPWRDLCAGCALGTRLGLRAIVTRWRPTSQAMRPWNGPSSRWRG